MAVAKSIVYKGQDYGSVSALAKSLGVKRSTLSMALNRCDSVDEAVSQVLNGKKPIEYKGVEYRSYRKLASSYGINPSTLNTRLTNGMTLEEALETPVEKRPTIEYGGKTYTSITELMNEYSVSMDTYNNRRRLGWSLEEIINTEVGAKGSGRARKVTCYDEDYPSFKSLADTFGVSDRFLITKVNQGYTPEEAINLYREKEQQKKLKDDSNSYSYSNSEVVTLR